MRVGLVTTSYPSHSGDISGHFVKGFADSLRHRDHRVSVITPAPPNITTQQDVRWVRYAPSASRTLFHGAGVPDNIKKPSNWCSALSFPLLARHQASALHRHCDVLVSHWALPSAWIHSARSLRHIPHLAVWHSADVTLASRLPTSLLERMLEDVDHHWFVSELHRDTIQNKLGAFPNTICPMGVGPVSASAKTDERFFALCLGRLVNIKRVHAAIDSCHQAECPLVVVGDGPERQKLEAHAKRINADVQFLGTRTGVQKWEWLHKASVLISTSAPLRNGRGEGVPVSILEAMHVGTPVIARQSGGIGEWVDQRNGRLCQDDEHVVAALKEFRDEPATLTQCANKAKERTLELSWGHLSEQLENTLLNLIGR